MSGTPSGRLPSVSSLLPPSMIENDDVPPPELFNHPPLPPFAGHAPSVIHAPLPPLSIHLPSHALAPQASAAAWAAIPLRALPRLPDAPSLAQPPNTFSNVGVPATVRPSLSMAGVPSGGAFVFRDSPPPPLGDLRADFQDDTSDEQPAGATALPSSSDRRDASVSPTGATTRDRSRDASGVGSRDAAHAGSRDASDTGSDDSWDLSEQSEDLSDEWCDGAAGLQDAHLGRAAQPNLRRSIGGTSRRVGRVSKPRRSRAGGRVSRPRPPAPRKSPCRGARLPGPNGRYPNQV